MVLKSSIQLKKRSARGFAGAGYRCATGLLGTPTMHIVVENDLLMPEDVP